MSSPRLILTANIITFTIFMLAQVQASEWNYKFTYTKNINSQMSLDCGADKAIWIGWSHYGTRSSLIKRNEEEPPALNPFNTDRVLSFPNEKDCWMNFTEKIAEQCNGAQHCDLSSQPTYIHKCGKISDYLYVSFKCIRENVMFDVCKPITRTFNRFSKDPSFYIKSSDFPDEYPWSLDCSCSITSSIEQPLKLEVLWFSLQDNDYVNIFNKNLSGWINPTYEMPILTKTNKIRFMTDDALAYKGFWLKVSGRKACRDDWQLVGDNCVKVFSENLDWRSANQRCQQMNGNLIKIDDVVSDLKLTQYMKSFYPEIDSYWIGLRKYVDVYNKERWMWSSNSTNYNDVSWWPWAPKIAGREEFALHRPYANNCVVKRRDEGGYFTTSCDSEVRNGFICQTKTLESQLRSDIRLECGQTKEVESHLDELLQFEKIGISSIKNYKNKHEEATKPEVTTKKSILIEPVENEPMNNDKTTGKAEIHSNFHASSSSPKSSVSPKLPTIENPQIFSEKSISSEKKQPEAAKLNTAILAGIISGIGLVIVVINLAVLFICRRNLKKFLKSTKSDKNDITSPDILQDYFEAFNTLQTMKSQDPKAQLKMLNEMNAALTLQQMKTLPNNSNANNRTVSINSGDEPLMSESAKLFYNSQFFKNMTLKQTEAALTNTTSAFKPFIREVNDKTLSQQQLLQPMDSLLSRNTNANGNFLNQHNQYDKITHIQPGQAQFDNQYAHTYECLDNSEKRLQLGTRGYNHQQSSLQSPNDNVNVSTSSTSSSSGASSTQHLIRNPNQHINIENLVSAQQLQSLTPAQLAMVITGNQKGFKCACGVNSFGDVCGVCGTANGSWSPDSAYYSSIPNYAAYNIQSGNQPPQFASFNFNGNENFKSHLV